MLTIASVLKTGGEYKPEHVRRLRDGFAKNLSIPHRFVCLTDLEVPDYECLPLVHNWPRWWGKIELFRPGLFAGPVFFADLDSIVVGNVDDLVVGHRWTMLENFWATDRIGSGLMAWSGEADLSSIYSTFLEDPARFMAEAVTKENWGDQGFIRWHWPEEPERFQRRAPGRVVSYKFHCRQGVPPGASIVCFHGRPRPWTVPLWSLAA